MASEWQLKQEICDIGRRLYARGYAAGNDGNISYRLSGDAILCTPTQICKGFMKPEDLCTVDMQGKQIGGKRQPTSEVLLHLEIYNSDPSVKSVVHCHPPHATAFAVARVEIPSCILPEVEIFLGIVPRAEYETPGSEQFAKTVRPFIGKANTVVLSNHGTVSWGASVEQAYWHTEILDGYCRILLLAEQIGNVERLPDSKVEELLDLKERFGVGVDVRREKGGDLRVNTSFGCGAENIASEKSSCCSSEEPVDKAAGQPDDFEALVRTITTRVVEQLQSG